MNLKCGDVVKICAQEEVPADIILISSSDMISKICYVNTINVDGKSQIQTKNMVTVDWEKSEDQ